MEVGLKRMCDWYDRSEDDSFINRSFNNDEDNDAQEYVSNAMTKFKKFCPNRTYETSGLYNFSGFNDPHGTDIVSILRDSIFRDFSLGSSDTLKNYEIKNDGPVFDEDDDEREALSECLELREFRLIHRYITSPEFLDDSTFRDGTDNDSVIYAIFSIMLSWTRQKLQRFSKFTTVCINRLMDDLLEAEACGLLHTYKNHPVCLSTFKLLHQHRDYILSSNANHDAAADYGDDNDDDVTIIEHDTFSIDRYVSSELKSHFHEVLQKLRTESWTSDDLTELQNANRRYGVPFAKFMTTTTCRPKYITGVACTGKTTILRELEANGWTIRSRGQLGTFGGKSRAPAYVASLHAALDYSYKKCAGFMIGDRGPIDNPLWTIIMQLCDPKYKNCMVHELLKFFDRTFNELVVRYHAEFQTVVFLDTMPIKNRQRMLKRGEGGDVQRGRIAHYVEAQFMAYYIFAVLFGHKIMLLPYRDDKSIDSKRHLDNARHLNEYFGTVDKEQQSAHQRELLNVGKLDNRVPDILMDYNYSKSLGIFK